MASPEQPRPHSIDLPVHELLASTNSQLQQKISPNGIHHKLLEQVIRTPGRQPSPQPTHLSVPGSTHHRLPHEEDSGYVAPKFEGKEQQMNEGMW